MHAALLALNLLTALRVPGPLSPRNASYRLEARLDPAKHTVTGRAHLSWRNTASGAAPDLVFHLYMNAFKNEASTFMRESHGRHRSSSLEKGGWGMITVKQLSVDGKPLTGAIKVDDTLMTVALPVPIAAGATAEIDIEFETLLPKVFARTGYHKNFYAIAQWFPKIAVWQCDDKGACRWRAHQHHLNSEFFADFGVYDVTFTLPARWVAGATGVGAGQEQHGEEQTLRFHAEDVHDFALFASPEMRVISEPHVAPWGTVEIVLLSQLGHLDSAPRHLAAVHAGLDELAQRLGPYPYSRVTVVDVPDGASGAGGMEYPTLFTTFSAPVPGGVHLHELVTVHELSHHYFCQMVASDEVEEAWLDEGLTDAMTDFGLTRMFGRDKAVFDLNGWHLSASEMARLGLRGTVDVDPPETRSFEFLDNFTYGSITYRKTAALLRTLESHLGEARFAAGLRKYFEDWRFGHPRIEDFTRSFDAGAAEDLSWFWNPTLRGTQVLDYQVFSIEVRPERPPAGLFDIDGGVREVEPDRKRGAPYTSDVVVHRKGEMVFPVELRVVFDDGSERREKWDGAARWKRYLYPGDHKVSWATVDPDHKVALEVRRWNDGLRVEADSAPRTRLVSSYQSLVSALLSAVGF